MGIDLAYRDLISRIEIIIPPEGTAKQARMGTKKESGETNSMIASPDVFYNM